jgi:ribA/ribD-fused uncharacterized protein
LRGQPDDAIPSTAVSDPILDIESLRAAARRGQRLKYIHFWGHQASAGGAIGKECLSQWWPAPFQIDGQRYPTAEHFMMAEKARLFGDTRTLERILSSPSPAAAKKLGREVRDFKDDAWNAHRFDIVVRGNLGKFAQNSELASFLTGTKNGVLVEASPVDRVWGSGLAAEDPGADNPELWRGLNLLGFALMKVRSLLTENG